MEMEMEVLSDLDRRVEGSSDCGKEEKSNF